MERRTITNDTIQNFHQRLTAQERGAATIEKYLRDVVQFAAWLAGRPVTREAVTEWKQHLLSVGFFPATVNGKLAALNALFRAQGWNDCRVNSLRLQRRTVSIPARAAHITFITVVKRVMVVVASSSSFRATAYSTTSIKLTARLMITALISSAPMLMVFSAFRTVRIAIPPQGLYSYICGKIKNMQAIDLHIFYSLFFDVSCCSSDPRWYFPRGNPPRWQ